MNPFRTEIDFFDPENPFEPKTTSRTNKGTDVVNSFNNEFLSIDENPLSTRFHLTL